MEDELYELETPELGEELSYSFASQQIQKQILKGWKNLKHYLSKETLSEESEEEINNFDKLLNYFY